jgi:hypothetical protein
MPRKELLHRIKIKEEIHALAVILDAAVYRADYLEQSVYDLNQESIRQSRTKEANEIRDAYQLLGGM